MNPNELLTLIGLAWPRLIIYPGGLALLALLWLVARTKNQELRTGSQLLVLGSRLLGIGALAFAWLGLALLPLPAAVPMGRTTDVVIILALLEWPRIIAIAAELRARDAVPRAAGARRLAAALNSYPPLILATLALAQPAGSLDIAALARPPIDTAASSLHVLHWLGAGAWVLALAPLIGLGPFRANVVSHQGTNTFQTQANSSVHHEDTKIRRASEAYKIFVPARLRGYLKGIVPRARAENPDWLKREAHRNRFQILEVALWVRGWGLAALAALPWLAPFGALAEQGSYDNRALLAIAVVPVALGGMIWLYDRTTLRQVARSWAWAYLALDAALLLALLLAAYEGLAGIMRNT